LEEKSVWAAKQNKHEFDEQKVKRDGILGTLPSCALHKGHHCIDSMPSLSFLPNHQASSGVPGST